MSIYDFDIKKVLLGIGSAVVILFILWYGYLKLDHIIRGPYIAKINIDDLYTTTEEYIHIRGNVQHIEAIRMNGKQIFTTEEGDFNEDMILLPGYNIVVFELVDHMGRVRDYDFPIVLDTEPLDLSTIIENDHHAQETNNQESN